MGKYSYILFDLDGTLTDPHVGITKSVQYALRHMGFVEPDLKNLIPFIGPPLAASFRSFYNMNENQSLEAVKFYREYFSMTGIFENAVYQGIPELLAELKCSGKILAVATSKPGVFANRIMEHFALTGFFDFVVGSNLDGSMVEKDEVIACVLKYLNPADIKSVVMVGDRKHDIIGAQKNAIDSIGVGYGYGDEEELHSAGPTFFAKRIEDLYDILC